MPQAIGLALFQLGAPLWLANAAVGVFVPSAFAGLGTALGKAALGAAVSIGAQALLGGKGQTVEDGKFNLRQPVPSRVVVAGSDVMKGGDYVLLEERDGVAWHITTLASHRILGFSAHWLHDEEVTLDGGGVVTAPTHFNGKVSLLTRLGLATETAYAEVVAEFPEIWSNDHRGDGLASVLMRCASVQEKDFRGTYPQGMPQQRSVISGGAAICDPREGSHDIADPTTWALGTDNLALIALFHQMHESGHRVPAADIYEPDWINAADVGDETVLNYDGDPEPRYAGGHWWRYGERPADVAQKIAEAADLMVYERADGKVGVHAGAFVEPDITLEAADIRSLRYDANARPSTTVTAVRGRYNSAAHGYTTVDAAVRGDPYAADDSDRSPAIENNWVRRHNHMQRLQELRLIRANAPRVSIVADYEPARDVPYRRWIRVNVPPRLDNAIVELTGRPKTFLRDLSIAFDGIVIPASLYDPIVEGTPPPVPVEIAGDALAPPENVALDIDTEAIGGVDQVRGVVTWDEVSEYISYEVESGLIAGGGVTIIAIPAGTLTYRTEPLADIGLYQFRVRSVSGGGARSAWSAYVYMPNGLLADSETLLLADATTSLHI